MKVVIIIPTYNESGSIMGVIDRLHISFRTMPEHDWYILIVDGNSPDGTADLVKRKQKEHQNIEIIVEKVKSGIASAYMLGMNHAVYRMKADVYVEFDGDGQHNPANLIYFIKAFENGADYIIGSRYIQGGSIPREWAWYRKLLSRFGSLFARHILKLPIHDITSGFKMTRVNSFGKNLKYDPELLLTKHYAYKIELLYSIYKMGARIHEVPIEFLSREHDISKSTWKDIKESLRVILLLRWQDFRKTGKFL